MTKPSRLDSIKKFFPKGKKPSIQEIVREPTAGGIVYRKNDKGELEILLIQDAKDRPLRLKHKPHAHITSHFLIIP
jgi:hypothetical protein